MQFELKFKSIAARWFINIFLLVAIVISVAAMAFSQARNLSREETIRLAVAMGAASVMQSGTQPPEADLVWELAKQVVIKKV